MTYLTLKGNRKRKDSASLTISAEKPIPRPDVTSHTSRKALRFLGALDEANSSPPVAYKVQVNDSFFDSSSAVSSTGDALGFGMSKPKKKRKIEKYNVDGIAGKVRQNGASHPLEKISCIQQTRLIYSYSNHGEFEIHFYPHLQEMYTCPARNRQLPPFWRQRAQYSIGYTITHMWLYFVRMKALMCTIFHAIPPTNIISPNLSCLISRLMTKEIRL